MNKLIISFKKLLKKVANTDNVFFTAILLGSFNLIFLAKILGGSTWITIAALFLGALILSLKYRDFLMGFLVMSIYTLQFYVPNKYYPVELFKAYELRPGFGGYSLSYGINIKNIFITITVLLMIREYLNLKIKNFRFIKYFFIPVVIPGLIYFVASAYSSTHYSSHVFLSMGWLLHYINIYIIAYLIYYLYFHKKHFLDYLKVSVFATIFLQVAISLIQFTKQSWAGLPIENAQYIGAYFGAPDAAPLFVRVLGTFAHSNQLSLILVVLLVILIPDMLKLKSVSYLIISALTATVVLLSQSRSGWMALFIVFTLAILNFKEDTKKLIIKIGLRRVIYLVGFILVVSSIVVIPRLNRSVYAFGEGGAVPLRKEMMKEAMEAIQLSPWVGYGVATNEKVLLNLFPVGYVYLFPAPVHLAYVQMLLESGLIGLIAFIIPFLYLFRSIHARKKGLDKISDFIELRFFFYAGSLAFAIYYFFQPHEGFREFYYLGIILGCGTICQAKIREHFINAKKF